MASVIRYSPPPGEFFLVGADTVAASCRALCRCMSRRRASRTNWDAVTPEWMRVSSTRTPAAPEAASVAQTRAVRTASDAICVVVVVVVDDM